MNSTISTMQGHRSIRKFKPDPIPAEYIEHILRSAQMASTSSNMQAYSIIKVDHPQLRKEIAELAGNQQYIIDTPMFMVWLADFNRIKIAIQSRGAEHVHRSHEQLLVGIIDATLAAQNAAIAAESLGLGIVYIGGIRRDLTRLTELLQLPQLVVPLFGMCVGYPDQSPTIRPRLPLEGILHVDQYANDTKVLDAVSRYDETYQEYINVRTEGKTKISWSEDMKNKFINPSRDHLLFLRAQGFDV